MLSKIQVDKLWSLKCNRNLHTRLCRIMLSLSPGSQANIIFLNMSLSKVNENVENSVWPQKDARI